MIFRLTQRLASKIKAGQLSESPLDENLYADWSARLFTVDRTQYIMLCNTASMYSVVTLGRGVKNKDLFIRHSRDAIREFMTEDGLGIIFTEFIAPADASVCYCKALNRSVTGSMNELVMYAKILLQIGERSIFDVSRNLNDTLLSAIASKADNYDKPRDVFQSLVV